MSENSQHLPIGHKISGHYEIIKVLGQGGFGIVYKVENLHRVNDNIFIIKELFLQKGSFRHRGKTIVGTNLDMRDVFEKMKADIVEEVDILASITNKNIVKEYGYFKENQTIYSLMEYIDGVDLEEYIKEHPFDENKAIDLLKQLIHGLKEIHAKNIIHRDIKPSNIMRTDKGGVYKIIDFTNNKPYMDSEVVLTGITSQGYSPPELWRKKAKVGAFSDIYSMGMTLIKLLTKENPPQIGDRSDDNSFQKSIDGLNVSRGFRDIIRKMTNKKSENRFQNLEEIESELSQLNSDIETEIVVDFDEKIEKKTDKRKNSIMKTVVKIMGLILLMVSIFFIVKKYFVEEENHIKKEANFTSMKQIDKIENPTIPTFVPTTVPTSAPTKSKYERDTGL